MSSEKDMHVRDKRKFLPPVGNQIVWHTSFNGAEQSTHL